MAELIDDGPLASVRKYAAVEQPHLTLPRGVVLGLLARLDAAEADRDALRAVLRELRDAAGGLGGLPGGSGGRYARALREAGRLLGEEPLQGRGTVIEPTSDDLALDLAAEMARPDHTRGSLAELAEAAVRRALHAEAERDRLRAGLDAALAEAGRWKNTWLKAEESESYLKDALQEIAETARAALGQRE